MSTSDRTFNQVKAILGKLDRSIDEARSKRLDPPEQRGPEPQQPDEQPHQSASGFGKARPLNRARPIQPNGSPAPQRPGNPDKALDKWID